MDIKKVGNVLGRVLPLLSLYVLLIMRILQLSHLMPCSRQLRLLFWTLCTQIFAEDTVKNFLSCRVCVGTQYATSLGRCSMEEGLLMTMTKDCLTPMLR